LLDPDVKTLDLAFMSRLGVPEVGSPELETRLLAA
jgi:hypothetical protein